MISETDEDIVTDFFSVGMEGNRIKKILDNASPDQNNPTGCYVYGHYDEYGVLFYVGKGTDKRAWSKDRHPMWHRYVEKHLRGKYSVRIIVDGITPEIAEDLETGLMAEYSENLVNWNNIGRKTDFTLLEKFHELRNANRRLIRETRLIEKTDIELAISNYIKAIDNITGYVFMHFEKGLVGQLLKEEHDEVGVSGELEALDRLTLCLLNTGRSFEAAEYTDNYFKRYKKDATYKSGERIKKRVRKALQNM